MLDPSSWSGNPISSKASGKPTQLVKSGLYPDVKMTAPKPVELEPLRRVRFERWRRWHLRCVDASLRTGLSNDSGKIAVASIAEGHRISEVGREMSDVVLNADEVTQQVDAHGLKRSVMQVVPPSPAAGEYVGYQSRSRAGQIGQCVVREWCFEDPGDEVTSTEPSMYPWRAPTCEIDVPSILGRAPRPTGSRSGHCRRSIPFPAEVLQGWCNPPHR